MAAEHFAPVCLRCGTRAEKRCARCKEAAYCGEECQRTDWVRHKEECGQERSCKEALGAQYQHCTYAVVRLNEELGRAGRELLVDAGSGTVRIKKRRKGLAKGAYRTTANQQVVVRGKPTPTIAEFMGRLAPLLLVEPRVKALVLCPRWPIAKTIDCGGFLVPLVYNEELETPEVCVGGAWSMMICEGCTSTNCQGECEMREAANQERLKMIGRAEELLTMFSQGKEHAGVVNTASIAHLLEYAKMIRQALGHNEAQVAWFRVERFLRAYIVGLDGREDDSRLYLMNGPTEVLELSTDYRPQRRPLLEAVHAIADLQVGIYLYYYAGVGLLMPDADFMMIRGTKTEE